MAGFYEVANWREYQHYKDRNPPWIKLHFALLSSETWVSLDDASRVLAVACMLLASRNEGRVPADPAYIKRVAYLSDLPNFKPLVNSGFLLDASGLQADASTKQADARPEKRREEAEERQKQTRKRGPRAQAPAAESLFRFAELLAIYPPDKSKPDAEARRWWGNNAKTDEQVDLILANTRVWLAGNQYQSGKGWNIGRYLSEGMVFTPPGKPAVVTKPPRMETDMDRALARMAREMVDE